jgi:hypothetical protein
MAFITTGYDDPFTFSNQSAFLFSLTALDAISVISRYGSTSAVTR